jgi:hypothetical protein
MRNPYQVAAPAQGLNIIQKERKKYISLKRRGGEQQEQTFEQRSAAADKKKIVEKIKIIE